MSAAPESPRPEGKPELPNPRRSAVALRYDQGRTPAPEIAATGRGLVADRILELAREHGIPIKEDRALVTALAGLDVGDRIPPELYLLVAEVFAWLYALKDKGENAPPAKGAR